MQMCIIYNNDENKYAVIGSKKNKLSFIKISMLYIILKGKIIDTKHSPMNTSYRHIPQPYRYTVKQDYSKHDYYEFTLTAK